MRIEIVNLSKEVLKKIKNIDEIFYQENILTLDWYCQRYNTNHKAILLFDHDECVGYLVSVPVKKELYDAIINGVMLNDLYLNPSMFIEHSDYNYIVSVVILEQYLHKGYGKQMLEKLFNDNKGYFCALTITKNGYNLANKRMNLVKNINDDVSIFSLYI